MSEQSTISYRDIPDFPGYRIGDNGSVLRKWVNRRGGKIAGQWYPMKTFVGSHGYLTVNLSSPSGDKIKKTIHTLVLTAFVGPCPPDMECRHLDGNRANPKLTNICWGSRMENANDRIIHGTTNRGERCPSAKLTADQVREIRNRYSAGSVYMRQLAAEYLVSVPCVSMIVNRNIWQHV